VASYGASAIEWIESTQKIKLRWWQKLAITRQLEHREDLTLCHREVIESAPRRAGKSWRMRGLFLWRMKWGPLIFGEPQLIMHTGSDLAICRQIQKAAWSWAENDAHWKVTRANGKEAIDSDDSSWLVRAQSAVYGYDTTLGAGDECWDVKPDTVSEGLEPSLLERKSPQLYLTSTAHRRATSLMRGRISSALSTADPSVLLMVWAARPDADPGDPQTWKESSPYWSEDRYQLMRRKYNAALAGESDPEFDDPDPMEGFKAQYLNIWRLKERRQQKGEAVIEAARWNELAAVPIGAPVSAAIESWFEQGYSLALGYRQDEKAVLSVTDHPDLASAVAALKASGFRGQVIVGASMIDDPELRKTPRRKGEGRTAAAVAEIKRLLVEDAIRHDGTPHLTRQILEVRTTPGADGPRLASNGRADALKAALWAASAIRTGNTTQKRKMVLPGRKSTN
jgi:hypothetical protein